MWKVSRSCWRKTAAWGSCQAEPGQQRLGVADGRHLRGMGDDRYLRQQVEPRDVVLVSMGDGDQVDLRTRSTSSVDLEGRVDQQGALRPADQQGVAGRVAAALRRGEERDAS